MESDSDWSEEVILYSSDDETRENGDFMMLEELYQQEQETLLFLAGMQQLEEAELAELSEIYTAQEHASWDHLLETSNDSIFSSDETISSTFAQASTSNDCSNLQLDEDPFIDSVLENEDVLVEDPLFVDCGTIDHNDDLDYSMLDDSQVDSILTDYFERVGSSLVDNMTIDKLKVESQLYNIEVRLERLSESTVQSITKAKVDSIDVTTDKTIELNVQKKSVQRYCHKCEKFFVDDTKVSQPKNCPDCGDSLIYSCTKCKDKYFLSYSGMIQHRKACKSRKVPANAPTSVVLYACQDCDFRTLHETLMTRHLRKTKHRSDASADGAERVEVKEAKYVRQYEKDILTAFQRLCDKCKEIVPSTSSADDKLCQKCSTRLLYRCIKCGTKSKTHKSLTYHLKEKCLRKKYSCCECNFVATSSKSIRRHAKQQHPAKRVSCEHCDFETSHKSILINHLAFKHNLLERFNCKVCKKYKTTVASLLEKHMLRKHSQKDESKTLLCAICRRYSTNDQNDLRKHIDRRHREK